MTVHWRLRELPPGCGRGGDASVEGGLGKEAADGNTAPTTARQAGAGTTASAAACIATAWAGPK
eukprot:7232020-Alexandrium_andersonii.AAC.1